MKVVVVSKSDAAQIKVAVIQAKAIQPRCACGKLGISREGNHWYCREHTGEVKE